MCIIVDANSFASVFNKETSDHSEFRPLLEWICRDKGKIVFGGTKYNNELKASYKYLRLFRQLDAARKILEVDKNEVDKVQKFIEKLVNHKDFDDTHIIAIIIVSGCKLICSKDNRAFPFFKNKKLYPKRVCRPRIYTKASNANLLCDKNIAECCKPATKSKELLNLLE